MERQKDCCLASYLVESLVAKMAHCLDCYLDLMMDPRMVLMMAYCLDCYLALMLELKTE